MADEAINTTNKTTVPLAAIVFIISSFLFLLLLQLFLLLLLPLGCSFSERERLDSQVERRIAVIGEQCSGQFPTCRFCNVRIFF